MTRVNPLPTEVKDEFVALIAHDLRTPLTSIVGYLELILEGGNLTEEQRRYLDVVDRNADRLLHLVNDLPARSRE